jgi:hypothetical protein
VLNDNFTCSGRQHPLEFRHYNTAEPSWRPAGTPQFNFVYLRGERPDNPDGERNHFQRYRQWPDSLGNAVISPAIPFRDTHVAKAHGTDSPGSTSAMSGLCIIRMGSLEEALAADRSWTFLEKNGTLEVSEMIGMFGQHDD